MALKDTKSMNDDTITKLQQAALDGDFAEWVREAVWRFAADYDLLDAAIHTEVIRQYENLYEDFVAKHFPDGDEPNWVDASPTEVERAMREDFESTDEYRAAATWSRDGSRSLSCGRDLAGKPIDLATLTDDVRRTLVALYLMTLGDSVLLVNEPPDWDAWPDSSDPIQSRIRWLVSRFDDGRDNRFERIGLVIDWVLIEWEKYSVSSCVASDDFSVVHWFGEKYTFNERQAVVVARLWKEWHKGTVWVRETVLFDRLADENFTVDSTRLRDLFRTGGKPHPAWNSMIVPESEPNSKKLFGLRRPSENS